MNICKLTMSPFSKKEKNRYDVHVHVIRVKKKGQEGGSHICTHKKKYFI